MASIIQSHCKASSPEAKLTWYLVPEHQLSRASIFQRHSTFALVTSRPLSRFEPLMLRFENVLIFILVIFEGRVKRDCIPFLAYCGDAAEFVVSLGVVGGTDAEVAVY